MKAQTLKKALKMRASKKKQDTEQVLKSPKEKEIYQETQLNKI